MPPSRLAHRAFDLGVAAVADHDDLAALLAHLGDLDVHLGHQRAGRVEHLQAARLGLAPHRLRHAVRAEDHGAAGGHLVQLLDEHRALGAQVVDHEPVVHDLVAHVDRRAELRERALDDRDGAVDAGAEAARIGEQDVHQGSAIDCAPARCAGRRLSDDQQRRADVIAVSATLNAGQCPAIVVEEQEIDDVPEGQAVAQVAERAAQDQRQAERSTALGRRAAAARR